MSSTLYLSKQTRFLRPTMMLIGVCALIVAAALPAGAQVPSWAKSTWPETTTTITTQNGWIVAKGMTLSGTSNRWVWATPLVRQGPSVSVQHGVATTFVQAGPRQFVINNADGRTYELRNGQIWRQWPTGGPIQPPVVPTTPPPISAANTGTLPMDVVPPPVPGEATEQSAAPVPLANPAQRVVQEHQKALEQLIDADTAMLESIQNLEKTQRLQQEQLASAADVTAAMRALERSREEARRVGQKVERIGSLATQSAPPVGSVDLGTIPPPQARNIRDAERRVLSLNALYNERKSTLDSLKANPKADPAQVSQAEQVLQLVDVELQDANLQLQHLNTMAALPPQDNVSPDLRVRLGRAEQNSMTLAQQVQAAQRQLEQIRRAREKGTVDEAAVNEAINQLTASVQRLSSANNQLGQLREMAFRQAGQGDATTPPAAGAGE